MIGAVTEAELVSQPGAWEALLGRLEAGAEAPLALEGRAEVLLVGSGSSFYLALALADWARRRGAPARAVPSCEVILDPLERQPLPGRLAVVISRSGTSSEALLAAEALKAAGAEVVALSCTAGSALLGLGDRALHVPEGHEDGLVMLRSFTSMLVALQWLWGDATDREALRGLPAAGRALLAARGDVAALASSRPFDRFVVLGSAEAYPLAREGALKVQEMSISTAESYQTLEYRHGPKATASDQTLAVLLPPADEGHGARLAADLRALGAAVLAVGPGAGAVPATLALPVDLARGPASAAVMLPLQLLALETARRLGRDPDAPVNLAKVVVL